MASHFKPDNAPLAPNSCRLSVPQPDVEAVNRKRLSLPSDCHKLQTTPIKCTDDKQRKRIVLKDLCLNKLKLTPRNKVSPLKSGSGPSPGNKTLPHPVKSEHETYVEFAREFVEELVENLPDNSVKNIQAAKYLGVEHSTSIASVGLSENSFDATLPDLLQPESVYKKQTDTDTDTSHTTEYESAVETDAQDSSSLNDGLISDEIFDCAENFVDQQLKFQPSDRNINAHDIYIVKSCDNSDHIKPDDCSKVSSFTKLEDKSGKESILMPSDVFDSEIYFSDCVKAEDLAGISETLLPLDISALCAGIANLDLDTSSESASVSLQANVFEISNKLSLDDSQDYRISHTDTFCDTEGSFESAKVHDDSLIGDVDTIHLIETDENELSVLIIDQTSEASELRHFLEEVSSIQKADYCLDDTFDALHSNIFRGDTQHSALHFVPEELKKPSFPTTLKSFEGDLQLSPNEITPNDDKVKKLTVEAPVVDINLTFEEVNTCEEVPTVENINFNLEAVKDTAVEDINLTFEAVKETAVEDINLTFDVVKAPIGEVTLPFEAVKEPAPVEALTEPVGQVQEPAPIETLKDPIVQVQEPAPVQTLKEPIVGQVQEPALVEALEEPIVGQVQEPALVEALKESIVGQVQEPVLVEALKEPIVGQVQEPVLVEALKEPIVGQVQEPALVEALEEPLVGQVQEPALVEALEEPIVGQVQEPAPIVSLKDPIVQVQEPAPVQTLKEPIVGQVQESALVEALKELIVGQVQEPALVEALEEPIVGQVQEPALVEALEEPIVGQVQEPALVEALKEPIVGQVQEPALVEALKEPIVGQIQEPAIVEALKEHIVEQVREPALVEALKTPIVGQVQEPAPVESLPEPIVEALKEPIVCQAQKSSLEPVQEPTLVESLEEPIVDIAKDPIVEQVENPAVGEVKAPLVKQIEKSIVEHIQKPAPVVALKALTVEQVKEPVDIKQPTIEEAKTVVQLPITPNREHSFETILKEELKSAVNAIRLPVDEFNKTSVDTPLDLNQTKQAQNNSGKTPLQIVGDTATINSIAFALPEQNRQRDIGEVCEQNNLKNIVDCGEVFIQPISSLDFGDLAAEAANISNDFLHASQELNETLAVGSLTPASFTKPSAMMDTGSTQKPDENVSLPLDVKWLAESQNASLNNRNSAIGSLKSAVVDCSNEDPFKRRSLLQNSPPREIIAPNKEDNVRTTPIKPTCNTEKGAGESSDAKNNHSEAGPDTAGTCNISGDELFKDSSAFEFLSSMPNTQPIRDYRKESLYVKFDPLVGSAPVAKTDRNIPLPPTFAESTIRSGDIALQAQNIVSSSRDHVTPTKNPALDLVDRLISLTPSPKKQESPRPIVKEEPVVSQPTREQEEMIEELHLLRELLDRQDQAHQEQLLKHKAELEELQNQLNIIKQRNQEAEEREQRLNKKIVDKAQGQKQMSMIMEEYEKTISRLVAEKEAEHQAHELEKEAIIKEKDLALGHLTNIEIAFSDVHMKYERSKNVIEGFKKNEEVLQGSLAEFEATIRKQEQKYDMLKSHAMQQLESANQELDCVRRSQQAENAKLKAMLKKSELKTSSLEEMLEQKIKENQELASICDDLISKVGN